MDHTTIKDSSDEGMLFMIQIFIFIYCPLLYKTTARNNKMNRWKKNRKTKKKKKKKKQNK
jgi:hypothetical protein